jgi:hypothetical protein
VAVLTGSAAGAKYAAGNKTVGYATLYVPTTGAALPIEETMMSRSSLYHPAGKHIDPMTEVDDEQPWGD